MADFLSLLSTIPSLIQDFSGSANPYAKQQQQLASNQLQTSNALSQGPNNPLYQSIYGQYKQQNANTMASQIAEAQGQNRMNANMGRTPLFSQERGSENIFRTLMQQQQGAGVQADQQTRAALGQGSTSALQGQASYNSIIPQSNAANTQNIAGYTGIANLLRGQQNPFQQQNPGSMGAGNYSSQMMQPQSQFVQPAQNSSGMNYYQPPQNYAGFSYL